MNTDTIIKLVIGIAAGIAWVVLAVLGLTDVAPLVAFLQTILVGLAAHVLTMVQPGSAPNATNNQGGFVSWRLLLALALVALAGCAGLNAQGVLTITYNTPATTTSATLAPGLPASAAK